MSRADLHIHSKYSERLSEEFLRKIGAMESYTEPEFIYATAKERGMDFVTITDHNRIEGALLLKERHPADVFTGVESTAYFPEDGCSIHLLIYGLDAAEFDEVQKLRADIYQLRDYLKEKNLAHSVAHATYSRNDKLNVDKLEKLILLFDVFEGINGGSSRMNNDTWTRILKNLTPARVEDLRRKHGIEPFGATPHLKGFTGGSDDHAGLFIGRTFTESGAANVTDFLQSLKAGASSAGGNHSDFRSLVFTLYKIAHDFAKTKGRKGSRSLLTRVNELVFENKPLRFREKLALRQLKYRRRGDAVQRLLIGLVEDFNANISLPADRKMDMAYDRLTDICDEFLKNFLTAVTRDLHKGDIGSLFKHLSSSVLGMLMTGPFLATFRYLYKSRELTRRLEQEFGAAKSAENRKVLWFTDSIQDVTGGSLDVEALRRASLLNGEGFRIAATLARDAAAGSLPGVMDIESILTFRPPYYEDCAFHVPSLLKSLEKIYQYEPDEIYISSLGPLGLLGLLAAKLLSVKCIGVYHDNLYQSTSDFIQTRSVSNLFESYSKWFYSHMDEMKVLERGHVDVLQGMGLKRMKISAFESDLRSYFGLDA
ncbi:MAG: PHP domain-containing protein [Endomicrobiales bacterium]